MAALAALLAALAGAAPAAAQTLGSTPPPDPNALSSAPSQTKPPPGHRLTARQVLGIANGVANVKHTRGTHPGSHCTAFLKGSDRWQVSCYDSRGAVKNREISQTTIFDRTGQVLESWSGFQVAWTMARGYAGAFGRKSNALYVWIPLCLLFLAPFIDPRRLLRRWLHLDLLVLLAFSISLAFFNHAKIGISVPLVYPLLVYLLVRMLVVAVRWRGGEPRDRPAERLQLLVPVTWLAVAIVFLMGFRIGLNVTNSNVIDVGYSGVIGADHILHGKRLYGNFPANNQRGDTYGPVAYDAYVPFTAIWPWSGTWDDLPAAHGAAVVFDVLAVLLLFLLGRRVRGPTLGIVLAYAWVTYPFTLFVSSSNSNDSLVAVLVTGALLALSSAPARGAMAALAGLAKFAPLALAPLLATYKPGVGRTLRPRTLIGFLIGFVAVAALVLWPVFVDTSPHELYQRTIAFQSSRGSPFSIWGLYGGLGWLQGAVQIGAVLLAVGVAFFPARRDVITVAALGAAVTIALQLGVTHWFYLYIVWFFPLLMVALLGRYREPTA